MIAENFVWFSVFALASFHLTSATYPACGSSDGDLLDSLSENINNHVEKLKNLRREGYGWTNTPEVALSIQLAQPDSCSALNETIARVSVELNNSLSNITLGRLSQYVLMIKSACHDTSNFGGKNLKHLLTLKLSNEFSYVGGKKHKLPRDGLFGFFLGLQAFCIAGSTLDHFYIDRALHMQNEDGSFGKTDYNVDLTAQALLGLECLSRKNDLKSHQRHRINQATEKASSFLQSRFVAKLNKVWIGNKYSSPLAVLAINEHSKWEENALLCKLVMDSLNIPTKEGEPESAIAQRLLALKGVTILELLNEDYRCDFPDLPPNESTPSYANRVIPCNGIDARVSDSHGLPSVMITVRITIHKGTHSVDSDSRPLDLTLTTIPKGKTLLEILKIAECKKLISFETETSSWGEFITAMDGRSASSVNREYWHITKNGFDLNVGVSQYKPSHEDHIVFRLKKWRR